MPTAGALRGAGAQTQLRVGAVDDPAERQADRMAHEVMARLARRDTPLGAGDEPDAPRASRICEAPSI